ncbi:amidohydrolase family protein [Brachybacterium huguangmaarense]|uniref:Amidohydrolase family protein n=1 Tax=Brachybacterium huguangmaarense TaxID=1652028 RepID=A0ABY6FYH0_9MICO|nr:amidohydrolase family protein [Brachybacterium huguangmaarense]UYG15981.1 amidohydrolase family protein [Brachybacterium huguangmaarense]
MNVDLALRGTAVLETGVVPDATVLVADAEIVWAGPTALAPGHEAARAERWDGVILPGLVDLHCHGGGGVSFPDCADVDEARRGAREHLLHGTTSLVASLVTASPEELRARTTVLAELVRSGDLAAIHLEGPFISPARKGAQNPAHIAAGDADLVTELCTIAGGALATMTVAPEAEGADAVIDALARGGAVPSLGHTDATAEQMEHGIARALAALRTSGSRSALPTATHLFNGMRPIHHRDPGPALACLDAAARGEMVVELIGDGVHLAPDTVRYVMDIAGTDHVVLVTDAMAAAGMPDGRYTLGALDVTVEGAVATLTEGGAIAGGTAHLLDVVRLCVEQAGIDLAVAVRAASAVPARVLGLSDRIGALAAGRRADVLLATSDLHAGRVLRGGVEVA